MRTIFHLIATAFAVLLVTHTMQAQSPEFKEPDFAYPKTVEEEAHALLDKADLLRGNDAAATRLRAVLELCAAQTQIDRNQAFAQPQFIALQAGKCHGAAKAMLLTLEAVKYNQIYTRNRWKYDRVDAPLEPYPADVSEWSGLQFRTRIKALFDEAIATAAGSAVTPLSVFSASVEYSDIVLRYIPDVDAFVRYQAYSVLSDYESQQAAAIAEAAFARTQPATAPYFYWGVAKYGSDNAALQKFYEENDDIEDARYVLQQMIDRGWTSRFANSYYRDYSDRNTGKENAEIMKRIGMLNSSLEKFPSWYGNAELKNTRNVLSRPRASYSMPDMAAPGTPVTINCSYSFAKKIEAVLYDMPADGDRSTDLIIRQSKRASVSFEPTETFGDTTLTVQAPAPGRYALVVTVDGALPSRWSLPVLEVAPIMGFAFNGNEENIAVATDFTSGRPLRGVIVKKTISNNRRNSKNTVRLIGKTNDKGFVRDTTSYGSSWQYYSFTYNGHVYNFNNNVGASRFGTSSSNDRVDLKFLPDRALYHPGDTIQWAVVAARREAAPGSEPAVLAGEKMTVKIFDANGQLADTAAVTTDRFGRAYGSFATKKDVLTGNYRIECEYGRHTFYPGYVTVSDFKLPTFEAKIDNIERDVTAEGDVRVTGSARTFTGMAVAGADVRLTLTGAGRWRWFMPVSELAAYTVTTNADGTFSVDIPAADFKSKDTGTHFEDFIISAVVTSRSAETAETSRNFTIGKPYFLDVTRAPRTADTSSPVEITFGATDANDKEVPVAVNWQIGTVGENETLDRVVAHGSATTGTPVDIDLSDVPAGVYSIRIEAADTTLAKPVIAQTITLYNVANNRVPDTGSVLWMPQTDFKAGNRSTDILVGVPGDADRYVYVAVRNGRKIVDFRCETLHKGFSRLRIDTPAGAGRLQVIIASVADGKVYTEDVSITVPAEKPTELVAESFRDRLVPGAGETWRFRLTDGSGKALDAAMIATMYNRALDKLRSGQWPSRFALQSAADGNMSLDFVSTSLTQSNTSKTIRRLNTVDISWPEFRFINPYALFSTGGQLLMQKARAYSVPAVAEEAEEELYDTAEGTNALNKVMIRGTGGEAAGVTVAEDAVAAEEPEADGSAAPDGKFDYRVAEQLQIFWQPSLVADAEGNIDLVFTMPDAIGSWTVKAFAWTPQAKAASYMAECMSTKPVMVQANLPRFLRQGDKARVLATVYNNSAEAAAVATTVELFDIATGNAYQTAVSADSIAAGASALVSIDIDVPTDASAIGYRVRSVLGSFSDGEQSAIPVLESSATVIESTQFYLNPKADKPYQLTVPAAGDATLTLQYCQNPIWTVVKAMRGISEPGITSNSIVSSLFSSLAGRHITAKDPAIASAIAEWKANPGEEALVSMLAKNENLKKLILDRTPWVQASKDQTSRMSALSDLLDPAVTAKAIEVRIQELAKLQNRDGGFAWGPWSRESSVWATEKVLTTLGIAHSLGMLAADDATCAMLQPAFDYLQTEATKPRRPDTDGNLALIVALLPELKVSPAADRVIRNTVLHIVKNWRKGGTVDKAYDIIILKANGRAALAAEVLESIRQHAVEQPGRGLCFPNVNDIRGYATIIGAYAALDAPTSEIDAMRQWITVYAQATDDLGAYNPDYIIAAVLMTGSDWTSVPVAENVAVDGRPVAVSRVESATGYFAQTIDAQPGKPTVITVKPNGVTPSYGSVISVGRRPMASVKAKAGDDLSIEKRVLVERDGQWVDTESFGLGERVRVQLVVKAKRDLEYVTIDDERPAAFEPVDQLPGYVWDGGLGFYRENGDAATRLFVGFMPKGTYHISYDMTASLAGSFISGLATIQSQYAPEITAHSAAAAITVE